MRHQPVEVCKAVLQRDQAVSSTQATGAISCWRSNAWGNLGGHQHFADSSPCALTDPDDIQMPFSEKVYLFRVVQLRHARSAACMASPGSSLFTRPSRVPFCSAPTRVCQGQVPPCCANGPLPKVLFASLEVHVVTPRAACEVANHRCCTSLAAARTKAPVREGQSHCCK